MKKIAGKFSLGKIIRRHAGLPARH